jgi:hypothetical protein
MRQASRPPFYACFASYAGLESAEALQRESGSNPGRLETIEFARLLNHSRLRHDLRRICVKSLVTCLCVMLSASAAYAASGDTLIAISYKTHAVRLRPKPASGDGAGAVRIVLHANGTVDDVVEGKGKNAKKWEMKSRKLGAQKSGAQYRILDKNTIERTFSDSTFLYIVKIMVDGKSCKADVVYTLKPGQKEFVMYSPDLGKRAYYSEVKPFDVDCRIE